MIYAIRFLHYLIQTALLLWLLTAIDTVRKPILRYRIQASLAILALILLYYSSFIFSDTINHSLFRMIYRILCFTLYIRWQKGLDWQKSFYFAGFISTVYYIHQNIFITPIFYPIFYEFMDITPSLYLNVILSTAIVHISCFLLYLIILRNIPFKEIERIGYGRAGILLAAMFCTIYVKYSLTLIFENNTAQTIETSVYSIMLQLFLIIMIIAFEKYMKEKRQQVVSNLQYISNKYKLESLQKNKLNQDELLNINHDIKNHLLAIKQLSNKSNNQLQDYINKLLGRFDKQIKYIDTGNELLNGLLSDKIAEGIQSNIEFSIIFDSRDISFINDMDLCTIFCNALDNAIEANKKVKNIETRYITIRSIYAAGQLLITISNAYEGQIRFVNGMPLTSKTSPLLHGIGLFSINEAIKKYNGTLSIDTTSSSKFILKLLIPLPLQE